MSAISNPRLPGPSAEPPAPPAPVHGEPESGSGRGKWIAGLVVLGIAGLVAWKVATRPAESAAKTAMAPLHTAKVTQGRLDYTVRLGGQTSAREFVNVVAPIMRGPESGREMILIYLIPTGSKVKKGQMIAKIDAQTLEDHIDDIGDDIEKAEADIRKRKAEQDVDMQTLVQNIRIAEAEYGKAKQDARAAEVRTDVERELLKLAEEESAARFKQLQADIAQKKLIYDAEVKILGITRERHVRHRGRHEVDLKKFTIYAPMDGMAVSQQIWRSSEMATVQQGDQVYPGMLFMKVVNPDKMQLDATINQAESGMYKIAQKATMRLDAFPGLTLPGRIYAIGALATGGFRQQYFIRNVPVKVAFDVPHEKLIPDLSGSADVLIQSEDNAKTVPLAAVFEDAGKTFVFVKKGQSYEKRTVELGLRNATHAAVASGLEVGDEVSLERPVAQPVQTASL